MATTTTTANQHLAPPDNSWKMTRYMRGVSVPGFASFLGIAGLVTSILNLILEGYVVLKYDMLKSDSGLLYFSLALWSLFNIGMFAFSFLLWKKVRDNNLVGMRSLFKIGCYIMAGLELLICAHEIIIIIINIITIITIISGIIFVPLAIFACLLIVGVHKKKPWIVQCCIICKIIYFSFIILGWIVLIGILRGLIFYHMETGVLIVIFILDAIWLIFYSSCFIVVHYNIMLHDQQRYENLEMGERQQTNTPSPPTGY